MSRPAIGPVLIMVALGTVVASIVAGMLIIGSPSNARAERADRRRAADLRTIAYAVDVFWTRHQRIPESVTPLLEEKLLTFEPRDPENGASYPYRAIDAKTFEVCADFHGGALDDDRGKAASFWTHGAGRQCFRPEAKNVDH